MFKLSLQSIDRVGAEKGRLMELVCRYLLVCTKEAFLGSAAIYLGKKTVVVYVHVIQHEEYSVKTTSLFCQ